MEPDVLASSFLLGAVAALLVLSFLTSTTSTFFSTDFYIKDYTGATGAATTTGAAGADVVAVNATGAAACTGA